MSDYEDAVDGEPPAIEPYEVLGLARDATADQIKSAYRKAALKNHPGALLRRTRAPWLCRSLTMACPDARQGAG